MANVQKITTMLWFADQAEQAANFYTSIFKHSRIGTIARYGKAGQEIHRRQEGSVMTIEFELEGRTFVGLNGGPLFQFTPAISFMVNCQDQAEIDHLWDKLCEGGDPKAQQCGWLKDKFGVSWQIIPERIAELIRDPRAMTAMMQMKKLDIAALERAARG